MIGGKLRNITRDDVIQFARENDCHKRCDYTFIVGLCFHADDSCIRWLHTVNLSLDEALPTCDGQQSRLT